MSPKCQWPLVPCGRVGLEYCRARCDCSARSGGSHKPPAALERLPKPSGCPRPPTPPGPSPCLPTRAPQVLTLRKLGWGAEGAQPETCYTRPGPGPVGAHPCRQRLCPWWGRGIPSLQERGQWEWEGRGRVRAATLALPIWSHPPWPHPHPPDRNTCLGTLARPPPTIPAPPLQPFTCIEFGPVDCAYNGVELPA